MKALCTFKTFSFNNFIVLFFSFYEPYKMDFPMFTVKFSFFVLLKLLIFYTETYRDSCATISELWKPQYGPMEKLLGLNFYNKLFFQYRFKILTLSNISWYKYGDKISRVWCFNSQWVQRKAVYFWIKGHDFCDSLYRVRTGEAEVGVPWWRRYRLLITRYRLLLR